MRVTIRKAVGAFVGTLAVAIGGACTDGTLTNAELIVAAGGALVVGGTVFQLKYKVPED